MNNFVVTGVMENNADDKIFFLFPVWRKWQNSSIWQWSRADSTGKISTNVDINPDKCSHPLKDACNLLPALLT